MTLVQKSPDFAWLLKDIKIIEPFEVKGKLKLYDVDHKITYLPNLKTEEQLMEYWEDLNFIF